jgi:hypothetical protein
MNEVVLKTIFTGDWIKFLLIVCALLIIMARHASGEKFQYLIKFWDIHRYFIYKSGHTINIFSFANAWFFLLRVVLFSVFITLCTVPESKFKQLFNLDYFIIISLLMTSYIVLKFLIEKAFSIILNYRTIFKEINRLRVGLKNLISLHFYFYFLIIIFNPVSDFSIMITSLVLFSLYLFFCSSYLIKKYSPRNFKHLLCFILYICTFEIAPILILVLFLKNIGKL